MKSQGQKAVEYDQLEEEAQLAASVKPADSVREEA
jgi:hypothetical protein